MDLNYKIIDNKYFNIKQIIKEEFHISDRLLRKLKAYNKIFLNNNPVNINFNSLMVGDLLSVCLEFDEESENIVPLKKDLDILYEDKYLLIVNKPSNMPVHPSCNHYADSLSNIVKDYYNCIGLKRKIRIVNRLDKDTSGIVIFAKNEYVQEMLIQQMKQNQFKKEYLAILNGILENSAGTISAPIARKETSIIERCVDYKLGDIAITHYDVIKTIENKYSLVHFILETGRTHQIRVHSAYIGHSIIGDTLYGTESPIINRQALHSYKVSFIQPITKEQLVIEAPLAKDMSIFF